MSTEQLDSFAFDSKDQQQQPPLQPPEQKAEQIKSQASEMVVSKVFGFFFNNFKSRGALNFTKFLSQLEQSNQMTVRKDSQQTLKQRLLDINEFNQILKRQLYILAYDYLILHKEHIEYIMALHTLEDIFKMVSSSSYVFYALHFLRLIPEDQWTDQMWTKCYKNLQKLLSKHEIVYTVNPCMIAVLIAEFLQLQSKRISQILLQDQYKRFVTIFLEVAYQIQKEIRSKQQYKTVYLDTDLDGRSLVWIIKINQFKRLLSTKQAGLIVDELWSGLQMSNINLLYFSSMFRRIKQPTYSSRFQDILSHPIKQIENQKTHYTKFIVWKSSCQVRHLFELLLVIFITFYFQYAVVRFLFNIPNSLLKNQGEYTDSMKKFDTQLMELYVVYIVTLFIQRIYLLVYTKLSHTKLMLTPSIVAEFFLFVLCIFLIEEILKSPNDISNSFKHKEFQLNMAGNILFLWFRIGCYLLVNESVGPNIRMILNTLITNIYFYVIIFIQIIAFSALFNTLYFKQCNEFKDIRDSFLFMSLAILGETNFDCFEGDGEPFGEILMCLFLFINTIVCFNLLVAILTKGYSFAMKEATAEYRSILLQHEKNQKLNDKYGVLIAFPAPFSFLLIFVTPFLLYSKQKERMNYQTLRVLFQIVYVPIVVIIFISVNMCLSSLAWFIIFFSLIRNVSIVQVTEQNKDQTQGEQKLNKILFVIAWFFLGLAFLIYWIYKDVINLVKFLMNEQKMVSNEDNKLTGRHINIIKDLISQVESTRNTQENLVFHSILFDKKVQEYFKKLKNMSGQKSFSSKQVCGALVKNWLKKYNFGKITEETEEGENQAQIQQEQEQEKIFVQRKKMKRKTISPEKKLRSFTSFHGSATQNEQQEMQRKMDKFLVKSFFERLQYKDKKTRQFMVDTAKIKQLLNEQKINIEDLLMTIDFVKTQQAIDQSYQTSDLNQADQANYILTSMNGKFGKLEARLINKVLGLFKKADIVKEEVAPISQEISEQEQNEYGLAEFQENEIDFFDQTMSESENEVEKQQESSQMDSIKQVQTYSLNVKKEASGKF